MDKTKSGEGTAHQILNLRELVRERLAAPEVSVAAVARESGVSRARVHAIRAKQGDVTVETLAALVVALDLEMPPAGTPR